MAKNVTEQEKEKMWQLYQQLHNYSKVAAKMHRDPSTVSRHVKEYEAAVRAMGYELNSKKRGEIL